MKPFKPLILFAILAKACGGHDIGEGLDEPLRVAGAQFVEGTLPGLAPIEEDGETAAQQKSKQPTTTSIVSPSRIVQQGTAELSVSGRTTTDADAIGVALDGAGSGYWVLPVGPRDLQFNGEPTWHFTAALAPSVAPGTRRLLVAAIDGAGHAGTQGTLDVCVAASVPDNLNACVPTQKPPTLVVSLTWDRSVDIDLGVVTPRGKFVSAKDPSTAIPDADGKVAVGKNAGVIDVDANAGCIESGKRTENLVFPERPASGSYLVYANLFDACDQAAVRFTLSLHARAPGKQAGTYAVKTLRQVSEVITQAQANAGAARGTFVTQFKVP